MPWLQQALLLRVHRQTAEGLVSLLFTGSEEGKLREMQACGGVDSADAVQEQHQVREASML